MAKGKIIMGGAVGVAVTGIILYMLGYLRYKVEEALPMPTPTPTPTPIPSADVGIFSDSSFWLGLGLGGFSGFLIGAIAVLIFMAITDSGNGGGRW